VRDHKEEKKDKSYMTNTTYKDHEDDLIMLSALKMAWVSAFFLSRGDFWHEYKGRYQAMSYCAANNTGALMT